MGYLSKLLVAGGLVALTGPLCFQAAAQDYIDVEAERAEQAARTAPPDPYGVKPAQSYPATSYGVNSAPAGSPVVTGAAAPGAAQNESLGRLYLQIQQLQQDVMRLNGIVEEQAHELRKLKEQSLERYVDLDKRLGAMAGGATVVAGSQGGASASVPDALPPVNSARSGPVAEQPGEGEAYRAAYALVRGQQFDQAVDAFHQFLRNYPDGRYAPNAHYWLGELYLVVQPQDLEASRQSFTLLVTQYPDNPKVPDALYKLGKVHFLKGNREKAREYLDGVAKGYPDSSAAKLARDFVAENY
jgi:tol-pal system protein YbgF